MIKEDIQKVLELALEYYKLEVFGTGKESENPSQERINWIYERMKPSLPSNLDEAAEEYGRKEYSHAIHFWDEGLSKNKPEVMKEDFVDAFKAGAEWMAGQGVSTLGMVGIYGVDVESITEELLDAGFRLGEEVILQIRKKQ